MLAYTLNETQKLSNTLRFRTYVDTDILGFTPDAKNIKFSGDGSTWYNYSDATPYSNVFSTSGKYIYLFISKTFLKKMVDQGVTISDVDVFTFSFNNTIATQSGYYQFSPSLSLDILPRDYGISIKSSDGSTTGRGSGKIGEEEDPIRIGYDITISGPRQAENITAKVTGESVTLDGIPYCLFSSSNDLLHVPISAYLEYTGSTGSTLSKRNSCSENEVLLNNALWSITPWDTNTSDDGNLYNTHLDLIFPMNEHISTTTVDGEEWQGTVSASGDISVTATWEGVQR